MRYFKQKYSIYYQLLSCVKACYRNYRYNHDYNILKEFTSLLFIVGKLHQGIRCLLKHYNQQATITTTPDDIPNYRDIIP